MSKEQNQTAMQKDNQTHKPIQKTATDFVEPTLERMLDDICQMNKKKQPKSQANNDSIVALPTHEQQQEDNLQGVQGDDKNRYLPSLPTGTTNETYKIPMIQEFSIMKNSNGDFHVNDSPQMRQQLPPPMMFHQALQGINEKQSNTTQNTPKRKNQSYQEAPRKESLAIKMFKKQRTNSIILEPGFATTSPSYLTTPEQPINNPNTNPNPNPLTQLQQNSQQQPVCRREEKQRIPLLTLGKKNDLLGFLLGRSNKEMKAFSETDDYHKNAFCCEMLYKDDCCLKWLFDLLFQLIFIPVRLTIFIMKVCIACVSEDEEEMPPCINNCFSCCYNCNYCPFKCCGDWINQCTFSFQQYICKGLWILPSELKSLYSTTSQRCLIQTGLFFKNCCFYTAKISCVESLTNFCCLKPFHLLGECLMGLCSPQGLCENMFTILKCFTFNLVSYTCIDKVFFCCTSKTKATLKENKDIIVTYCFGCAINSSGETENVEQNL